MRITYNKWTIYTLGDHAIVFALSPVVNHTVAQEIGAFNNFIQSKKIDGVKDIIPAYHTITLILDILYFKPFLLNEENRLELYCTNLLSQYESDDKMISNFNISPIEVPVCYDIEFGIDLLAMSEQKKIAIQDIIQQHCSQVYTVYCIGFLPGFAYMGSVPESIQTPRHATPRNKVYAGSVGIAGVQTGIYPSDSPGGWQIIGRTPEKIFDPNPAKLAKFKMGDQVKFYPINATEFNELNQYS
jgi:inhibitor of KinA